MRSPEEMMQHVMDIRTALTTKISDELRREVLVQLEQDPEAQEHMKKLRGGGVVEKHITRVRKSGGIKRGKHFVPVELPSGISDEVLAEELSERAAAHRQMEALAQRPSLNEMKLYMATMSQHCPAEEVIVGPLAQRYMELLAHAAKLPCVSDTDIQPLDVPIDTPVGSITIPETFGESALVLFFTLVHPGNAQAKEWKAIVELAHQPTLDAMRNYKNTSKAFKKVPVFDYLADQVIKRVAYDLSKCLPADFPKFEADRNLD